MRETDGIGRVASDGYTVPDSIANGELPDDLGDRFQSAIDSSLDLYGQLLQAEQRGHHVTQLQRGVARQSGHAHAGDRSPERASWGGARCSGLSAHGRGGARAPLV